MDRLPKGWRTTDGIEGALTGSAGSAERILSQNVIALLDRAQAGRFFFYLPFIFLPWGHGDNAQRDKELICKQLARRVRSSAGGVGVV